MTKELTEVIAEGIYPGASCNEVLRAFGVAKATALQAHLSASGYVIVPREPTEAMAMAGAIELPDYDPGTADAARCYRAMLSVHKEQE